VVDFVNDLHDRTELPVRRIIGWADIAPGRFYDWRERYGKANEHNGKLPRDHWLLPWEVRAMLAFHEQHPLDGYRRLAFMMLDEGLVAASPATVYRVLRGAGVLDRWNSKPSKRARVSTSRSGLTSTGTSTSRTSTSLGHSTTCARCSTVTAD